MWYNSPSAGSLKSKSHKGLGANFPNDTDMKSAIQRCRNLSSERLFLNMADCTATLHSFSDSQQLLDYALDTTLAMADATAGSVFIWDEVFKELVLRSSKGPYLNQHSDVRVKLRQGISGWVADKGRSVLVKDVDEDDRFSEIKRSGQYQTSSFISLPILSGHKLVGVINVTEKNNMSPFDEEDIGLVSVIAKHLGLAYENLKAERRLWKENENLAESVTQLRESIKQQEPLVSIGKLSANLAHELNNPRS